MHLDSNSRLHGLNATTMECPRCRVHSRMTLTATPDFAALSSMRPSQAGMVFQCQACRAPVFVRYRIKNIGAQRIDFYNTPHEVEKPGDRFNFAYVPDKVAVNFRDALACYRAGLMQAFVVTCRATAQIVFEEFGDSGRQKIFDEIDEIIRIAELDDDVAEKLRNILFDNDASSLYFPGGLDKVTAAVLVEVMKDVLHQSYIRHARLRKVLTMRKFFADPDDFPDADTDPKVLPITRNRNGLLS